MVESIKNKVITFYNYRNLLKELAAKEIKLKYRRSYLGMLWSLLNPLFTIIIMTIVFKDLFRIKVENYPVYFMAGKLIFDFNAASTKGAMESIVSNSPMIKKIYIPKYIFPLAKVMSNFISLLFSVIALIIVMIYTKAPLFSTSVFFVIPILYTIIFSIGLGLLLAAMNVFFRDTTHLYGILLTVWTYITPLFYAKENLKSHPNFLKYNPLFHFIDMFRDYVYLGELPTFNQHIYCLIFSFAMLIIGLVVFKKSQDKFILYI